MILKKTNNYIYVLLAIFFVACSSNYPKNNNVVEENDNNFDSIFCLSTIRALFDGGYDGIMTVGELKKHGNCGLGTFDRIDGEMIVLNDTVYQCRYDGSVVVAADSVTVPFATVKHFNPELAMEEYPIVYSKEKNGSVVSLVDEVEAKSKFDKVASSFCQDTTNMAYVVILSGYFEEVNVRSEKPQTPPYKPLVEVMKTDQTFFTYKNISGAMVAMYTPESMSETTGAGMHYHFISDDRTKGGHVSSFKMKGLQFQIDVIDLSEL